MTTFIRSRRLHALACASALLVGLGWTSHRPLATSSQGQPAADEATDSTSAVYRIGSVSRSTNPTDFPVEPSVAFNPPANEYMAVWPAKPGSVVQIYGQRLNASTGAEIGIDDFQISQMLRSARDPSVHYNAVRNEYLVVWGGDNYPVWSARQLYAQRLTTDGERIGDNFLIAGGPRTPLEYQCGTGVCSQNPDDFDFIDAYVSTDTTTGEQLIVYHSASWLDDGYPYQQSEAVVARRVADGIVGEELTIQPYIHLPQHGGYRVFSGPAAYDPDSDRFIVLWSRLDDWQGVVQIVSLHGVFVHVSGVAGAPFQINTSTVVPDDVRIAHNIIANELLVVWTSPWNFAPPPDPVRVRGQRVSFDGERLGLEIAITNDASSTLSGFSDFHSDVAYDPRANEYVVVWMRGTYADSSAQLYGRRLSAAGEHIGTADVRLSDDRLRSWKHGSPAIACGASRQYVVALTGALESPFHIGIYATLGTASEPFVTAVGSPGGGDFFLWAEGPAGFNLHRSLKLPWPWYNTLSGELHPAMGDVDGDGADEVILGLAQGGQGWIAIFDDRAHGYAFRRWVQLSWSTYNTANGSIWPAVGDIDGDGRAEIVAGFGQGGGGYFAVIDDAQTDFAFMYWRRVGWPWYFETQSGESHPALMNLDADPMQEVVIGLGAGGQGWLEVFDDVSTNMAYLGWTQVNWSVYTQGHGATYPAAGDLDGDGRDELVVGLGPGSQGWVEVFRRSFYGLVHRDWLQLTWPSYALTKGQTHPAVGNLDGDRAQELVLGLASHAGQGGYFEVRDDATRGYASRQWLNVNRAETSVSGGATFPAIGRSP